MQISKKQMFYISVILVCLLGVYVGLADADFYWQSDLGRAIVQDGNFNHIYDQVWGTQDIGVYLDHEWLCNILFYFLSCISFKPIFFAKLFFCVLTGIGFVWWLKSESFDLTAIKSFLILLSIALYTFIFLKIKAYTASVIFLMLEIRFLQQFYRSFSFKDGVKLLILLVFWNNFHSGSIPLFFVVAGCFWLFGENKKKVLVYALACIVLLGLTPYGYRLALFDFEHFFDPVMKKIVMDWRPLDTNEAYGVVCFILIALYVVMLFLNKKLDKSLVLLSFIVIYMAFGSARHIVYLFPILLTFICSAEFPDFSLNFELPVLSFFTALLVLVCGGVLFGNGYDSMYTYDYIDDDLEKLLKGTNDSDSYGLYNDSCFCMQLVDLKSFSSGAFPLTRQRGMATDIMGGYAGVEQIETIINYYDLSKFLILKYNGRVEYMLSQTPIYEYLDSSDEYVKLYDNGFACYFVRKDYAS